MAQSRETDLEKTLDRKEKYGGMKRAMYLENYAAMGMLPTPTVVQDECDPDMWDKRMKRIVAKGHNSFTVPLTQMAMRGMLPTPTAVQRDHPERVKALKDTGATDIYSRKNGVNRPNSILDYINFHQMAMKGMLPTPNASEGFKSVGTENQDSLTKRARQFSNNNLKLNPQFVAEMMGFPNKWTEKPFEEDAENSFDAVDFNDFPTSYPIVQEEFEPNTISHSRWRRESIKGYGNAVVPQVVLEIFKAIEKYENLNNENQ